MNVLVVAPHKDDEVLGVGGTIAKHAAQGDVVFVCVVTSGREPLFSSKDDEKAKAECITADKILGVEKTIFLDFPASMLETIPRYELNDSLIKIVQEVRPDIVYIPHRGDMQLDHKMTVDAMMVALRPKYEHVVKGIYAYETLSETGWDIPNTTNDFIPTVYNDISECLDIKIKALNKFTTQMFDYPNARSIEAIKALAMFRGASVGLFAAEAFYTVREIKTM